MPPSRPQTCAADAVRVLAEQYGMHAASCKELPSYDDRNFLLEVTQGSGRYVLKVHNLEDSLNLPLLQCQNAVMSHLTAHGISCNQPVANLQGDYITPIDLPLGAASRSAAAAPHAPDAAAPEPADAPQHTNAISSTAGEPAAAASAAAASGVGQAQPRRRHAARLLTYVEGKLLKDVPMTPALRHSVGCFFGLVDAALAQGSSSSTVGGDGGGHGGGGGGGGGGFDHPAAHRPGFEWGLVGVGEVIRKYAPFTTEEGGKRAMLLEVARRYDERVAPIAPFFRRGCIHGDGNEQNLLVLEGPPPPTPSPPQPPAAAAAAGDAADGGGGVVGAEPRFGLLDFGDFHHSWLVAEAAIAAAYVALLAAASDSSPAVDSVSAAAGDNGGPSAGAVGGAGPGAPKGSATADFGGRGGGDGAPACAPLEAAADVARGYNSALPLTQHEWAALPTLVLARIAQSLAMGAESAARCPENAEYLLFTQRPGWAALTQLLAADEGEALRHYRPERRE